MKKPSTKMGRKPLSEKFKSTTIQVRVPSNVREWFKKQSKLANLSESKLIRELLTSAHAKANKITKKKAA